MLQPHQIKKEDGPSPESSTTKCTCKSSSCREGRNPKSRRQVLVNFGLSRKKVFTLSEKDKLDELFKSYVLNEPAFSGLLEDSYVIFQEFSEKFDTWVDVDPKETLEDGAVLNAVFFPSNIERDESNPGSIKRKEKELVIEKCMKRSRKSEGVVEIDLSTEETNVDNTTDSVQNGGTEMESTKKSKCHKKKKNQTGDGVQNSNGIVVQDVKKEISESEGRRENVMLQGHNNELSNKHQEQAVQENATEHAEARKPPFEKSFPQNTWHNGPRRDFNGYRRGQKQNYSRNALEELGDLCTRMCWPPPVYNVTQIPQGDYRCRVWVNNAEFFGSHKNRSKVKEESARFALIHFRQNSYYNHHQRRHL